MRRIVLTVLLPLAALLLLGSAGCENSKNSDRIQREQGEVLMREATSQVNMPGIKNFRERKLLKQILELRDQEGLITYTYLENQIPKVTPGRTALAGKLTYLGETVGYGIPYATQFTNPQKPLRNIYHDSSIIAQADPNGLFSPVSAEGTWVLMRDPRGKQTLPVYIEPRVVMLPFRLPAD